MLVWYMRNIIYTNILRLTKKNKKQKNDVFPGHLGLMIKISHLLPGGEKPEKEKLPPVLSAREAWTLLVES